MVSFDPICLQIQAKLLLCDIITNNLWRLLACKIFFSTLYERTRFNNQECVHFLVFGDTLSNTILVFQSSILFKHPFSIKHIFSLLRDARIPYCSDNEYENYFPGDVTIDNSEDANKYQNKIEESLQSKLGFQLKTGDSILTHFDNISLQSSRKRNRRKSKVFER